MIRIVLVLLSIIGIILALLLTIILLVVFVPVRYRVYGRKKEDIYAKGRVSWLLHLLHGSFVYENGELRYQVRIFGIPLIGRKKADTAGKNEPEEMKPAEESPAEVVVMEKQPEEPVKREELVKPEENVKKEEPLKQKEPGKKEKTKKSKKQKKAEKPKQKWKLKEIIEQIKQFWQENKPAVQKIFQKIRALMKALLPKWLEGTIWFGTGDPCTTGEITGVLAILYGFYGGKLNIYPDFNQALFMAELLAAGKIRLFTFIRICITVLLDKDVRRLIKNVKSFRAI